MSTTVSPSGRATAPSLAARLLRGLPNLIVFALLGCLFYWGHSTGWKVPKFSALVGNGKATAAEEWCATHSVPEELCVECREELLPRPAELPWCKAHGVAVCPTCHPEAAQVKGEPRLPKYDQAAALALVPRAENNSKAASHKRRLQFVSAEAAEKAGVEVDVVQEQPMSDFIPASGEITFDPTRVTHLAARAGGSIWRVNKAIGERVEAGEVLALVEAAAVGQVKADYLQALVQTQLRERSIERLKKAGGSVAERQIIEAESALSESEIRVLTSHQALVNLGFTVPEGIEKLAAKEAADRLRFLGIPSDLVANLPAGQATANLIPVIAPRPGLVVDSHVIKGEIVTPEDTLFVVADPERMCLTLHVSQEQARYLKSGLPVRFSLEEGGPEDEASISWISAAVDERTRTLRVRADLANPEGRLKDKTFVSARVVLREESSAIVVPREAVQSTSDSQLVFVRDKNYFGEGAPKVFHVRPVRLGAKSARHVEILAGVLPGEVVAAKGSAVLLAELLRGNLGAGCACHE
jgi:cobalt-zinc-cadmium efflux system membrane fusion protein